MEEKREAQGEAVRESRRKTRPHRSETLPQYIASVILSFLAFVTLLGCVSCAFLSGTLLSERYYLAQADRSTFAGTALYELRETYRSYAAASGVEAAVLEGAISEEQIRAALGQTIRAAFSGGEGYDYDGYAAAVEETLVQYAKTQGIEDTPELRQALAQLVNYSTGSFIALMDSIVFDMLFSYATAYGQSVTQLAWILAGITVVCLVTMALLTRRLSILLRNMVYTLGAVFIAATAVPVAFRASGFLQRVNLSPPSMKQYITACLDGFVGCYWWLSGAALLLLAACAIALAMRTRRHRQENKIAPPMRVRRSARW